MVATVDTLIQDSVSLRAMMEKYKADFGEDRIAAFNNVLNDALKKDTAQKNAFATMQIKTQEQDAAMERAHTAVTQIQSAAKAVFGRDHARLKEFRVGESRAKSVKDLITTLEYFTTICQKYNSELLGGGLTEDSLANASKVYGDLVAADATQENSKKLRSIATAVRDEAESVLREEVFKMRKFAAARFANDKAKLGEFTSILRNYDKKKQTPEPPPAPSKPAIAESK